jgi:hypothetical protein
MSNMATHKNNAAVYNLYLDNLCENNSHPCAKMAKLAAKQQLPSKIYTVLNAFVFISCAENMETINRTAIKNNIPHRAVLIVRFSSALVRIKPSDPRVFQVIK